MFTLDSINEKDKAYWEETIDFLCETSEYVRDFLYHNNEGYDEDFAELISCQEYSDMFGHPIYFNSGCSKICIISNVSDVVIKIPFSCGEDFCEIESRNYIQSAEYGLDKMFAGTVLWNDYLNRYRRVFYFSEKMYYTIHSEEPQISRVIKNSRKYITDNSFFGDKLIDSIIRFQYGNTQYDQVVDFCCVADINDIHGGNVMFSKGGILKFTDYSGFWDCGYSYRRSDYDSDCESSEPFGVLIQAC